MSAIENLLLKNFKKRKGWSKQVGVDAYRLYDWQIPEYPFFIDKYSDEFLVYDRTEARDQDRKESMVREINTALINIFSSELNQIVWKMRSKQKGKDQYEKIADEKRRKIIAEGERKYYINLRDYLDTGLFLDHRPLRNKFQKESGKSFLNLFSYTCSVGVAAALGGARTTNVDLSKTYLSWGSDNYELNGIDRSRHQFIHTDVLGWLKSCRSKYDVIFLDPPSFSNSKRMEVNSFDVLRDQDELVEACLSLLEPGGVLYFSNNHSKFKLSQRLKSLNPENITEETIPFDFHNKKVHWCFLFKGLPK